MVERGLPKPEARVRFPSPAPVIADDNRRQLDVRVALHSRGPMPSRPAPWRSDPPRPGRTAAGPFTLGAAGVLRACSPSSRLSFLTFKKKEEKPRQRFYLLPGMGGRLRRKKKLLILKWTLGAGLLFSGILAVLIYLLNRLR